MALLVLGGLGLAYLWRHDPHDEGQWMLRCPIHWITGLQCPSCGATRMVYDLLHARWSAAWADNAVLLLAMPLAALAYGRWLVEGLRGRRWRLRLHPIGIAAVATVAVTWTVVRNIWL